MVLPCDFEIDPPAKRAKEIERAYKMQQAGIISIEEFKKMAEEHAKESNPMDMRERMSFVAGETPRRKFKENLRKLKDRNEIMDSKSKLPWKGFKI